MFVFMRNATRYILAYSYRRLVRVRVFVCVSVCVCVCDCVCECVYASMDMHQYVF